MRQTETFLFCPNLPALHDSLFFFISRLKTVQLGFLETLVFPCVNRIPDFFH